MKILFLDFIKRPTFISILGIIFYILMIPLIVYQMMTLDQSSSLGYSLEILFLIIYFFIMLVDRALLEIVNNKILSIIEFGIILSFLIYYYINHNNSFSIG